MFSHTCLFLGCLIGADPEKESKLVPQFDFRQEMVWTGTFSEEIHRLGSKLQRVFDFEGRVLVLEIRDDGTDLVVMTSYLLQSNGETKEEPIVRLELIHVDKQGAVSSINPLLWLDNKPAEQKPIPAIPFEGPPSLETGMFIPLPKEELREGLVWDTPDSGRPYRGWLLEGTEQPRGSRCYKIQSTQQSGDWERGSDAVPVTRKKEDLWLCASKGIVSRVERVIERRDPNDTKVSYLSKFVYEQHQRTRLTGDSYRDRMEEIKEIVRAQVHFDQLHPYIGRDTRPFDGFLNSIEKYETLYRDREELPYRAVLTQIKNKADAAKRGQLPPVSVAKEETVLTGLFIGKIVPDFLAKQFGNDKLVRLHRLQGKPVLLLYFQPNANSAKALLAFGEQLHQASENRLHVLGVALGDTASMIQKQSDWKITFPVVLGTEIQHQHKIEGTPKMAVLDRDGYVRGIWEGWGPESDNLIQRELEKWLK